MPTPSTSDLPKPKSWNEFEDIVWEIYTRRWQDPYAQRYGRSGQAQHGVDIYGQESSSGCYSAIQCKRYEDNKLTSETITKEIAKVQGFPAPISKYIIATTVSTDVKIQNIIIEINGDDSRRDFSVHVVFWEQICSFLADSSNHDLLRKYYSTWEKVFTAQQTLEDKTVVLAYNPLDGLIARKYCDCINYLGFFINYFVGSELGYEEAKNLVNSSICTNVQNYDPCAVEEIVNIFRRKSLEEGATLYTNNTVSWKECIVEVFERIYFQCENLLTKYGSSASPQLIIELERIKDVSGSMVDFTNSAISWDHQEECTDKIGQRVYANSFLKPYLIEVIRARMLAIRYLVGSA